MLHAPAYDATVLGEVKSAYVNALTKFGPRQATRKGEDEDDREPRRGRKTVRDVQKSSGPRSLSRKAVSDGLWYSLRTFVVSFTYSADAMDEDTDIEQIPDPRVAEKQQRSGGRPAARPAYKSQGMSFQLILTLAL